jgi:hypothetical protein
MSLTLESIKFAKLHQDIRPNFLHFIDVIDPRVPIPWEMIYMRLNHDVYTSDALS